MQKCKWNVFQRDEWNSEVQGFKLLICFNTSRLLRVKDVEVS